LREAHVKAPQRHAGTDDRDGRAEREHEIGAINSAAPTANTPQRFTRSESQPAGYADSAYATFMTTSTAGT
jgi:hypothetical protein